MPGFEPLWLWPRWRHAVAAAGAVELGAVAAVLESKNGMGKERCSDRLGFQRRERCIPTHLGCFPFHWDTR